VSARHVTQISFRSEALAPIAAELDPEADDYINPGLYGSMLADRVAAILKTRQDMDFSRVTEDHGVHFHGRGSMPYTAHVVCVNVGDIKDHRHLVFVEPSQRTVRPFPWIRSYETAPFIPELVDELRIGLSHYADISDLSLVPYDQPL
jgi:hypothetical protein